MQVLKKNGEAASHLIEQSFSVEHICKGGFRFLSKATFELEDRLQVQLKFPDDYSQKVLGRICYSDVVDDDRTVYGFSIIDGFYSNIHLEGCV